MNKNEKIIPFTAAERTEMFLKRAAYAQELEELEGILEAVLAWHNEEGE